MIKVEFKSGGLAPKAQEVVTDGFARHTSEHLAPHFAKERLNWLAYDENQSL